MARPLDPRNADTWHCMNCAHWHPEKKDGTCTRIMWTQTYPPPKYGGHPPPARNQPSILVNVDDDQGLSAELRTPGLFGCILFTKKA